MHSFIEFLGTAGAIIVTYSNIPQIVLFFKQKNADGISVSSTWIGLLGTVLRTIYLIYTVGLNMIVLGPYFFAIFCILVCLYYMYFPTRNVPVRSAVKILRNKYYYRRRQLK